MCKEHKNALETTINFIQNNHDFNFIDLQNEIIRKGGVLRIAPGFTIKDFINELIEANVLEYDYLNDRFIVKNQVDQRQAV